MRDLSTTKHRKEGRKEEQKEARKGDRIGGRESGFKAIVSIHRELNQSIELLLRQPSQFLKCSAYNVKKNAIMQQLDILTERRRRLT